MTTPSTALQLRSLVRSSGELEVALHSVPVPEPGADEVLVRIEATPINCDDRLAGGQPRMAGERIREVKEEPGRQTGRGTGADSLTRHPRLVQVQA